jgi:hypothetical protein
MARKTRYPTKQVVTLLTLCCCSLQYSDTDLIYSATSLAFPYLPLNVHYPEVVVHLGPQCMLNFIEQILCHLQVGTTFEDLLHKPRPPP